MCLVLTIAGIGKWFNVHFGQVTREFDALSKDNTRRLIINCRMPIKTPAKALIVHGETLMGKSTFARAHAEGLGFSHLEMEFIRMRYDVRKEHQAVPVNEFIMSEVKVWLSRHINMDIVIEGRTMSKPEIQEPTRALLKEFGWRDVKVIHFDKRNYDPSWEMRGWRA